MSCVLYAKTQDWLRCGIDDRRFKIPYWPTFTYMYVCMYVRIYIYVCLYISKYNAPNEAFNCQYRILKTCVLSALSHGHCLRKILRCISTILDTDAQLLCIHLVLVTFVAFINAAIQRECMFGILLISVYTPFHNGTSTLIYLHCNCCSCPFHWGFDIPGCPYWAHLRCIPHWRTVSFSL
jgi:hypothetical protein